MQSLPGGSWNKAKSCRNVSVQGQTLHAELMNRMGKWNRTQVAFLPGQEFGNVDGHFQLVGGHSHGGTTKIHGSHGGHGGGGYTTTTTTSYTTNSYGGGGHHGPTVKTTHTNSGGTYITAMKGGYKFTGMEDMPTGSWRHSSQNARVMGYTLIAELKNKHGKFNKAEVHFMPGQSFGNNDGRFVLEADQFQSGMLSHLWDEHWPKPQGSYLKSSKHVVCRGHDLFAELKDSHGKWVKTAIRRKNPQERYQNNDGRFEVEGGEQHLPKGNWQESARNYRMQGNMLYAQLKDKHGNWQDASVQVKPGDQFKNKNGTFKKKGWFG